MKKIFHNGLSLVMEGVFFLVPVSLLILLFTKLFDVLQNLLHPILKPLAHVTIIGVGLKELIAILVLLIICFLIGMLARTEPAKKFIRLIERKFLKLIPGYDFIKSMGLSLTGLEEKKMEVVLAKVSNAWQLSFLVEQVDDDLYTVFIPAAPALWSGAVYFVEKERIMHTTISKKQAMNCIRQLGFGSAVILKDNISLPLN